MTVLGWLGRKTSTKTNKLMKVHTLMIYPAHCHWQLLILTDFSRLAKQCLVCVLAPISWAHTLPSATCLFRRKKIAVFPLTRQILFQTPDCYFLSVKMQNKKVKQGPSTKYLYSHKITGLTLFFYGEKIKKKKSFSKKKKSFSYLPTKFFFSMSVETQLLFFFFAPYRNWVIKEIVVCNKILCLLFVSE